MTISGLQGDYIRVRQIATSSGSSNVFLSSALPMEPVGRVERVLGDLRSPGRGPPVPRAPHCEEGGPRRQGVQGGQQGGADLRPLEDPQEVHGGAAKEDAEEDAEKCHLLLSG